MENVFLNFGINGCLVFWIHNLAVCIFFLAVVIEVLNLDQLI